MHNSHHIAHWQPSIQVLVGLHTHTHTHTHTHKHTQTHKTVAHAEILCIILIHEAPKSLEHRPEQLGSNSRQTVSLETDCAERSLQLRRDARSAAQGKENEKKGCSPCRQASVRLRLCPLSQGLSFPHRTG